MRIWHIKFIYSEKAIRNVKTKRKIAPNFSKNRNFKESGQMFHVNLTKWNSSIVGMLKVS